MNATGRSALRNTVVGMAAAICVVVLFTGFVLVSKYGLRTALVRWDLAALRFTVAGLVLLPVALKYGLLALGQRRSLVLAASGGLGFALCAHWGCLANSTSEAAYQALALTGAVGSNQEDAMTAATMPRSQSDFEVGPRSDGAPKGMPSSSPGFSFDPLRARLSSHFENDPSRAH